jgi:hypothetical protein
LHSTLRSPRAPRSSFLRSSRARAQQRITRPQLTSFIDDRPRLPPQSKITNYLRQRGLRDERLSELHETRTDLEILVAAVVTRDSAAATTGGSTGSGANGGSSEGQQQLNDSQKQYNAAGILSDELSSPGAALTLSLATASPSASAAAAALGGAGGGAARSGALGGGASSSASVGGSRATDDIPALGEELFEGAIAAVRNRYNRKGASEAGAAATGGGRRRGDYAASARRHARGGDEGDEDELDERDVLLCLCGLAGPPRSEEELEGHAAKSGDDGMTQAAVTAANEHDDGFDVYGERLSVCASASGAGGGGTPQHALAAAHTAAARQKQQPPLPPPRRLGDAAACDGAPIDGGLAAWLPPIPVRFTVPRGAARAAVCERDDVGSSAPPVGTAAITTSDATVDGDGPQRTAVAAVIASDDFEPREYADPELRRLARKDDGNFEIVRWWFDERASASTVAEAAREGIRIVESFVYCIAQTCTTKERQKEIKQEREM